MSFADNLRTVRKERNVSQEELADILNVSRQAVSKWEQGTGYPEMETLIMLAKELNISLDYLVTGEDIEQQKREASQAGKILITSYDGKSTINCIKLLTFPVSTRVFKSKPNEPQYILAGVDTVTFWGENRTILGWYMDEESVKKEQLAIVEAMKNSKISYELQYAVKVKKGFLSVKLDK